MDHRAAACHPSFSAAGLEALVRPLLETAQRLSGLESVFLSGIDPEAARQHVLIAWNSGSLRIPEGTSLAWEHPAGMGTPEDAHPYDVALPFVLDDCAIARDQGIRTCVTCPVRSADGSRYGSLCGASAREFEIGPDAARMVAAFASLIGMHLERHQLAQDLARANAELAAGALTDALTGLPNRRALESELGRMLARAERDGTAVFAAFVDFDNAGAGDTDARADRSASVRAAARHLEDGLRGGDVVARVGDHRFVVSGTVPRETAHASSEVVRARLVAQLSVHCGGNTQDAEARVDLVVARVGEFDAGALLALRDASRSPGEAAHPSPCMVVRSHAGGGGT